MQNETHKAREQHEIDVLLRDALDGAPPAALEESVERQYHWAKLALEQSQSRPRVLGWWMRPSLAAGLGFLLAVAGWIALDTLWHPRATWAEVEGQFQEATSFAMTIINSDNDSDVPQRMNLWFGEGGRLRIHYGELVAFVEPGGRATAFDLASGERLDPAVLPPDEVRRLELSPVLASRLIAGGGAFNLETLLRETFSTIDAPVPALNAEPTVAQDLWVFDTTSGDDNRHWMRVWALRDSRLPIRVRTWEADDAGSLEMLFDYADIQPARAFDPEAFAAGLTQSGSRTNQRFALLEDPAGKPLTPAALHEETGYHLPEVVEVGRTADGIFWVRSWNGMNETPEGHPVYGFGRLRDNLGQEYLHQFLRHRVKDDEVIECFVPLRFGLDVRRPESITLEAWSQPDHFREPVYTFGATDLSTWKDDTPFPGDLDNAPNTEVALQHVIREWERREQWDTFDQLIALIPGEPETSEMARFRESQRLRKWTLMGRDEDAFALAQRLVAAATAESDTFPWDTSNAFREYLLDLADRGEIDQAEDLMAPYRAELLEAANQDRTGHFIADLAHRWQAPEFPEDVATRVFGFDPMDLPEVAEKVRMLTGSSGQKPDFQPWYNYLETVDRYMDSQPSSDAVLFMPEPFSLPKGAVTNVAELPGHPNLCVRHFSGPFDLLIREWAMVNGHDFNRTAVDPALAAKSMDCTVVYPASLPATALLPQVAAHLGVRFSERPVRKQVWVARYDGRPLPNWRDVHPPELGGDMTFRGGGRGLTAQALFRNFEQILDKDGLVIVDETGLPHEIGENQTAGTIALTYEYAFGETDEAIAKVRSWFAEQFGITFVEDVRDVTVLSVAPAGST